MGLRLTVTDWIDATRWRWLLEDQDGHFVADHQVRLDPASAQYQGFCDLARYLDYNAPLAPPQAQLARLGAWVGEQVFGGLRAALLARAARAAEVVQVLIPPAAGVLLGRPFELACFADGTRFGDAGLRLAYQADNAVAGPKTGGADLRLLAVFSLPVRSNPLNLRRERYELQQLVRQLRQTHGLAIELRVLQYGATRDTLREVLEEADGWDVIHLSGHGQHGELMLETENGGEDPIDTLSLGRLLAPARARLKLLLLDACHSGAASHAQARAQVGLEAVRDAAPVPDTQATALPSLGHALAHQLDCAVLAMRYPVGDGFATELMLALYRKLLEKRQPLPGALQLAIELALKQDLAPSDLSAVTPVLLGARAAGLQLTAPRRTEAVRLPGIALSIGFPLQPPRFVGRLQPMLRASQALAPHGPRRAVLFHGMPGAGKTACALELAYRHEQGRFGGHVWYQAPEAGSDIQSVVFDLMHEIQRQLNAPDLGLTTSLADPAHFRTYTLPQLGALLEERALLLVLDNLETLLTDADQWRIPLFGDVLQALLGHHGLSRVVLTSRRMPAALAGDDRLLVEPIHALSFAESVLLARELPGLRRLFVDKADHPLLRQTLRVVQGHPELMRLADGLATDRAALQARVDAAEAELATSGELLDAFFAKGGAGESRQDAGQFVQALHGWTDGVLSRQTPGARQLFAFLCRLEPIDRQHAVLNANWHDALVRLAADADATPPDRDEVRREMEASLGELRQAGLIDVTARPAAGDGRKPNAWYGIHPGVAEAALDTADPALLRAADIELGNLFLSVIRQGRNLEGQGSGATVVDAARRGIPYLMRTERWDNAVRLIEVLLQRDDRPETIAFALPLLESVVARTAGTPQGLSDESVLAKALSRSGRRDEAYRRYVDLIDRARAAQEHKTAASLGSDLLILLWESGRLDEAEQLLAATDEDSRRAALGPWTRIADICVRLQVLAALGRYQEVREEVDRLRPQAESLPEQGEEDESVVPWNVRETLFDIGRNAALHTRRWEEALAFNDAIMASEEARGAAPLERARTRFNNYAPLLELGRTEGVRSLLVSCRDAFEEARDRSAVGKVYSAMANLEDKLGAPDRAVEFERLALGHRYQIEDPDGCGISHHNLANYLDRCGGDAASSLAHRIASALIRLQTRSGHLQGTLRAIVMRHDDERPPSFEAVARSVSIVPGVRLAELLGRLPRTFDDHDLALQALWQLVPAQRTELLAEVLARFDPFLRAWAAMTAQPGERASTEPVFDDLTGRGYKLPAAVRRIWAGERDLASLVAGMDLTDRALVARILELIAEGPSGDG